MFEEKNLHFASALFSKDMLRIVKGFAPWILFECFEEKFLYPLECRFYIHWSAGRSPRVHEVNPGRDPSKAASHEKGETRFFFFFFLYF